MADEKSTEKAGPKDYGELRRELISYAERDEPEEEGAETDDTPEPDEAEGPAEDEPKSKPEGTPAVKDEDAEATPGEGSGSVDEPKPEGDTPSEPESGAAATPEADRPEGETPPAAEDSAALEERVVLETADGKRFTIADLRDPAKYAEFETEREKALLRQDKFTQRTQETAEQRRQLEAERETIRRGFQTLQAGMGLLPAIVADEDMTRIVREFGNVKIGRETLFERLLLRPNETRGILASAELKERLWDRMEYLRNNPAEAERIARAEEAEHQNAGLQAEIEAVQHDTGLGYLAVAIEKEVENLAAEFPGVEAEEVERAILELGGLSPEILSGGDVTPEVQNRIRRGFEKLALMFLDADEEGKGYVRPEMIRREFQRLQKLAPARDEQGRFAKEDAKPAAPAPTKKQDEHNAAVKAALDDAPPPPPSGAAPGAEEEDSASQPKSYKELRQKMTAGL